MIFGLLVGFLMIYFMLYVLSILACQIIRILEGYLLKKHGHCRFFAIFRPHHAIFPGISLSFRSVSRYRLSI
ncbi:hypothetical protein HanHA300_Chr13g0501191 [Helianthus annuus]|nr:hypothetical protein HanHA300_Chr13g0501191 [Helianthus annuus]KAJ0499428.1 hypothetical protein HanHA89_Chr13g0533941 [Helianthus annuus]KAJ0665448.1 hypothetical protein HanLR1_Chr13g0504031 [Helianthus annuus]